MVVLKLLTSRRLNIFRQNTIFQNKGNFSFTRNRVVLVGGFFSFITQLPPTILKHGSMLPNGSFSNSKPIYNLHKSVFFKPLWGSELQMTLNVFRYYFSLTLIFFTHANAQFNLFAASTVRS